jgi:hypothetical protein
MLRRLFASLALLAALTGVADAGCGPHWILCSVATKNAGPVAGVAATNFLARTSGLSATERNAYINLINGLVADGIITGNLSGAAGCGSVLDALYILSTNTTTTAKLNLCGTSFSLVYSGTPPEASQFSADHGYTGDGSTVLLNTQFNPSTAGGNFALNSASLGVYDLTNRAANASLQIGAADPTPEYDFINVLQATGSMQSELNGNANNVSAGAGTSNGLSASSRTGSTAISMYKNGSSTPFATPATTSVGRVNNNLYILGANISGVAGSFTSDQLSAVFIGGGLTGAQYAALAARINAYMTAVGCNVY